MPLWTLLLSQAELSEDLFFPERDPPKRSARELGVVVVPAHDFANHSQEFSFQSFYTKTEAISAMVSTNIECLRLQKMNVFNTSVTKSVLLEEFEQLQSSNMVQLNSFLKDKWTIALKNCIKSSLGKCPTFSFNINFDVSK